MLNIKTLKHKKLVKYVFLNLFQELMEALVILMDACEKTNTLCQLQEGTLLGAVKLENILPWERDCDISVLSSQFNNLTNFLEKNSIGKLQIRNDC